MCFALRSIIWSSTGASCSPQPCVCRCGLLAEALQLARAYVAAQCAPAKQREALQALLTALFEWVVAAQQQQQQQQEHAGLPASPQGAQGGTEGEPGGAWARVALLELCFTQEVCALDAGMQEVGQGGP